MEWRGAGILVAVRRHGESSAIIEVFTETHGLHAGVVRGGAGRRMGPILQPGAQLDVVWRARLEDHIGSYTVEPIRSRAAAAMADRLMLAGLNAVTSLLSYCLPERQTHAALYRQTEKLLDLLEHPEVWPLAYLKWEMALLAEVGFSLQLDACAVSGVTVDLGFVSPKSGRAVSRAAAGEWADRLLPLPDILRGIGNAPDLEVFEGLKTTGHFFHSQVAATLGGRPLPQARARFVDAFSRRL
ncbi:DNA repair protein RecO [Ascidiaceihabitans sp.]|nr:DNA repair protein RecO [Ascidiaceihabitans sp.]